MLPDLARVERRHARSRASARRRPGGRRAPSSSRAPPASVVPVKRIQPSFTNVTSPRVSVVQIITGALSARSRKLGLRLAQRLLHRAPLVDVGGGPDVARELARRRSAASPPRAPSGRPPSGRASAGTRSATPRAARKAWRQRVSSSARSSGWALRPKVSPSSSSRVRPVKRSQPSLTNVTCASASVIHISAGVVSASSRKRASLSRTRLSWRAALGRQPDRARERAEEVDVVGAVVGAARAL